MRVFKKLIKWVSIVLMLSDYSPYQFNFFDPPKKTRATFLIEDEDDYDDEAGEAFFVSHGSNPEQ